MRLLRMSRCSSDRAAMPTMMRRRVARLPGDAVGHLEDGDAGALDQLAVLGQAVGDGRRPCRGIGVRDLLARQHALRIARLDAAGPHEELGDLPDGVLLRPGPRADRTFADSSCSMRRPRHPSRTRGRGESVWPVVLGVAQPAGVPGLALGGSLAAASEPSTSWSACRIPLNSSSIGSFPGSGSRRTAGGGGRPADRASGERPEGGPGGPLPLPGSRPRSPRGGTGSLPAWRARRRRTTRLASMACSMLFSQCSPGRM